MYDELVKRLRLAKAVLSRNKDLIALLSDAADAIAELEDRLAIADEDRIKFFLQIPRWIPVTERLPEEDGCYLVAVKNDHKRRYSKTAWFSHDSWFARQDVTHWMPLPEPPMEEK